MNASQFYLTVNKNSNFKFYYRGFFTEILVSCFGFLKAYPLDCFLISFYVCTGVLVL